MPRVFLASHRYTPSSSSTGSLITTRSKLGALSTFMRRGQPPQVLQPIPDGREEATTRSLWSSCSWAGGSLSTRHSRKPLRPAPSAASGSSRAVSLGWRGASVGRKSMHTHPQPLPGPHRFAQGWPGSQDTLDKGMCPELLQTAVQAVHCTRTTRPEWEEFSPCPSC